MTDLTREQIEEIKKRKSLFDRGEAVDLLSVGEAHILARQLLATMTERDEAQAAQAGAVERCAERANRAAHIYGQREIGSKGKEARDWQSMKLAALDVEAAIRALAHPSGLAMLAELRAERDAAIGDRTMARAGREIAIADRDELRAAIFGSPDYAADLRNGNFREMAETLHSAQKGGIARAEKAEAERERLAAANAVLEAKVTALREAVDEQTKARAQHWLRRTMTAPEDAEVEALCERCGYGAVMDAASRLWARKPYGSGAFYIGGCIGFKSDEEARAALATQEAGT